MKLHFTNKTSILFPLLLFCAAAADVTLGPILLRERVHLRFSAATAILIGMYRGRWAGLLAGWFAGLLLAGATVEHFGQSMLTLGAAGFLTGYTRDALALCLPPVDMLVFLALLLGESFLANIVALCAPQHCAPGLGVGGILLTALFLTPLLWIASPGENLKHQRALGKGHGHKSFIEARLARPHRENGEGF